MQIPRLAASVVRLFFLCLGLTFASTASAQVLEPVAHEFVNQVGFLHPEVLPDVSNSGLVVFSADFVGTFNQSLYMTDGNWVANTPFETQSYEDMRNIEVDDAGDLIFTARRVGGIEPQEGLYRTSLDLGTQTFGIKFVIQEAPYIMMDLNNPPARRDLALTSDGEVFFSTIVNGRGGLYRGPASGPYSLFQLGSGTFFNTKEMDLNEQGEYVIQMEYLDPTLGLSRGALVFDAPMLSLFDTNTAYEKLGVGEQYVPDINNFGQVAFIVDATNTMTFYDPPHDSSGSVVATVTLTPGIWLSTPTPFGEPPILTQLVGTSTGFSSFSRVLLDDFGRIVFQAAKTFGGGGIYDGPNPVANKIVEVGEEFDGRLFSVVILGKGNDLGQFAMITSDFFSTDREVWRVTPAPEPGTTVALAVGWVAIAHAERRRRVPR